VARQVTWTCDHQTEGCLCRHSAEAELIRTSQPEKHTAWGRRHLLQAEKLLAEDDLPAAWWHVDQAHRLNQQTQMPRIPIGPVQINHSPEAEKLVAKATLAEQLGLVRWETGSFPGQGGWH
jgi:hypothetical protein